MGGERHRSTCSPVHAHACANLPQHVRGHVGGALARGCDGGDVGDGRSQFPFVCLGPAPFPSLLSRRSCLLTGLCGHTVPTSGEREHSNLSRVGLFRFLFRVDSVRWRPFRTWLGGGGGLVW